MSSTPIDPEAHRYVEEFQQRLAQSGRFYRQALQALYEDRVMRDLQSLHQPPQPRQPFLRRAAHAGIRASEWIGRRFSTRPAHVDHAPLDTDGPEVIEGSYVVLSEETGPGKPTSAGQADANQAGEPIIHVYKENKENQP